MFSHEELAIGSVVVVSDPLKRFDTLSQVLRDTFLNDELKRLPHYTKHLVANETVGTVAASVRHPLRTADSPPIAVIIVEDRDGSGGGKGKENKSLFTIEATGVQPLIAAGMPATILLSEVAVDEEHPEYEELYNLRSMYLNILIPQLPVVRGGPGTPEMPLLHEAVRGYTDAKDIGSTPAERTCLVLCSVPHPEDPTEFAWFVRLGSQGETAAASRNQTRGRTSSGKQCDRYTIVKQSELEPIGPAAGGRVQPVVGVDATSPGLLPLPVGGEESAQQPILPTPLAAAGVSRKRPRHDEEEDQPLASLGGSVAEQVIDDGSEAFDLGSRHDEETIDSLGSRHSSEDLGFYEDTEAVQVAATESNQEQEEDDDEEGEEENSDDGDESHASTESVRSAESPVPSLSVLEEEVGEPKGLRVGLTAVRTSASAANVDAEEEHDEEEEGQAIISGLNSDVEGSLPPALHAIDDENTEDPLLPLREGRKHATAGGQAAEEAEAEGAPQLPSGSVGETSDEEAEEEDEEEEGEGEMEGADEKDVPTKGIPQQQAQRHFAEVVPVDMPTSAEEERSNRSNSSDSSLKIATPPRNPRPPTIAPAPGQTMSITARVREGDEDEDLPFERTNYLQECPPVNGFGAQSFMNKHRKLLLPGNEGELLQLAYGSRIHSGVPFTTIDQLPKELRAVCKPLMENTKANAIKYAQEYKAVDIPAIHGEPAVVAAAPPIANRAGDTTAATTTTTRRTARERERPSRRRR